MLVMIKEFKIYHHYKKFKMKLYINVMDLVFLKKYYVVQCSFQVNVILLVIKYVHVMKLR